MCAGMCQSHPPTDTILADNRPQCEPQRLPKSTAGGPLRDLGVAQRPTDAYFRKHFTPARTHPLITAGGDVCSNQDTAQGISRAVAFPATDVRAYGGWSTAWAREPVVAASRGYPSQKRAWWRPDALRFLQGCRTDAADQRRLCSDARDARALRRLSLVTNRLPSFRRAGTCTAAVIACRASFHVLRLSTR